MTKIEEQIAALEAMNIVQLQEHWQKYFKSSPPVQARREFLLRHINW